MSTAPASGESGLLVVDKQTGLTSQQVVGRCRRLFGTRKVGHAGTLDPMATGVLLVGVNRATRLLGHLALHDKSYRATIRLGVATVTDDAEGEIISRVDASGVSDERIAEGMSALTGDILQVPSSVSAIKINGRRAYARVRGGEQVSLPARPVTVSRFAWLSASRHGDLIDLDVEVDCTKGTYIRALARDLGAGLGVGGHLTALRRTRIGRYTLDDAVVLGDPLLGATAPQLMSMARAARLSFAVVDVDAAQRDDVLVGRPLALSLETSPTGLIDPDGRLIALYQPAGPELAKPLAVLA
ncbi:tRNA pseudouridine(55) synthase TruB [Propionibacterium sp.]|uniref:tRNA pseudouridine(55) synthase TruB n=1 Tax=Propionibacterium sp. TaxID=1977903 RepID=UPI0039E86E2F